jgi:hypothetical protein
VTSAQTGKFNKQPYANSGGCGGNTAAARCYA